MTAFPPIHHSDKFGRDHNLYTLGSDIRDAVLLPIDLPLRHADETLGGMTKRNIFAHDLDRILTCKRLCIQGSNEITQQKPLDSQISRVI